MLVRVTTVTNLIVEFALSNGLKHLRIGEYFSRGTDLSKLAVQFADIRGLILKLAEFYKVY